MASKARNSVGSKLVDLQAWVSIERAAQHLSELLDETVSPADILRLGIDKRLTLSVRLIRSAPAGISRDDDDFEITRTRIDGVLDLPMFGDEHLEVERAIQRLLGKTELPTEAVAAILLTRGDEVFLLLSSDDPKDETPASRLPEDFEFVVRTQALKDFAKTIETGSDKPLGTREKRTLLVIIASLCDKFGIKYLDRGAAKQIATATEETGAPVSEETIKKLLDAIPDALESREKA